MNIAKLIAIDLNRFATLVAVPTVAALKTGHYALNQAEEYLPGADYAFNKGIGGLFRDHTVVDKVIDANIGLIGIAMNGEPTEAEAAEIKPFFDDAKASGLSDKTAMMLAFRNWKKSKK